LIGSAKGREEGKNKELGRNHKPLRLLQVYVITGPIKVELEKTSRGPFLRGGT
jgi:hypothetical protein